MSSGMDKETALNNLLAECFNARLAEYQLCDIAGVSRATLSRWKRNPDMIRASTLNTLEKAVRDYVKGQSA